MLGAFSLGLAAVLSRPAIADGDRLRAHAPYEASIPEPEQVLGYRLGTRHTVLMDQERVVRAIVDSSARTKYLPYGTSTEGRPLRVVAISSPGNIARLDEIRAAHARLAKAKKGDSLRGLESTPPIVWVNECIHGDETASFESAMALIYNLAASNDPAIVGALEKVVVMVNPCYNPDGHERYVVAYNSIPNGNGKEGSYDRAIPSAFLGRANHYRFDMNRDRIAMSQLETRQEVAFMLSWNPQVYADQHGQVENYFMPPVQQSINVNVGRDRYVKWTEIFGRATAQAFDGQGWSYFVRDSFDLYAPCYLDSFATLTGAIGMTHETNGGRVINSEDRDGFTVTLREGIEKHMVSALAVIQGAATQAEGLMSDYADFKMAANSGEFAGDFKRVVLQGDRRELLRLQTHLGRMGVESTYTEGVWTQAKSHDYWSGESGRREFSGPSLVVDMAQSQGPLAKAMLEPGSDFEPEFVERQKKLAQARKDGQPFDEIDNFEFYDLTGWSLPYAYGIDAWWCEDTPGFGMSMIGDPSFAVDGPVVGYYLPYRDRDDMFEAVAAMRSGIRVSLVRKKMVVQGQGVLPGSFLVLRQRNPEADLSRFADRRNGWLPLSTSFPDVGRQGPGSETIQYLRKPEIGVVLGDAGSLSGGSLWYLMETEFQLPFRSLTSRGWKAALPDVTALVIPAGVSLKLDESLREWVSEGGSLVLLGGGDWAMGGDGFFDLKGVDGEDEIPGTLFRAELDSSSVISYGYPRDKDGKVKLAVPISGTRFFKGDGQSAAKVVPNGLLSGWAWDDSPKTLEGTSWCESVELGRGRVTWFADDPTERAQWPGLWKMVLNAIVLGPG